MKLLPLIGALLLSTAPVQAFETLEELDKACGASEENSNMCAGAVEYGGTMGWVSLLCTLEEKGRLTKENLVLTWDEWNKAIGSAMWNAGAEKMLEIFHESSLKPFP